MVVILDNHNKKHALRGFHIFPYHFCRPKYFYWPTSRFRFTEVAASWLSWPSRTNCIPYFLCPGFGYVSVLCISLDILNCWFSCFSSGLNNNRSCSNRRSFPGFDRLTLLTPINAWLSWTRPRGFTPIATNRLS